jgi:hypothetical protein
MLIVGKNPIFGRKKIKNCKNVLTLNKNNRHNVNSNSKGAVGTDPNGAFFIAQI